MPYNGQKKAIILGLSCAVEPKSAIYLSTPISSGDLLLNAITKYPELINSSPQEYLDFIRSKIIPKNTQKASEVAHKLRATLQSDIVIDPARFFIETWSQSEYLELWEEVIRMFAKEVYFNEYWYYSNGCVHEYQIALEEGLPCFNHMGKRIKNSNPIQLINRGIHEQKEVGIDTAGLEISLKQIALLLGE